MWIFTNMYLEDEQKTVYGVGYIIDPYGKFKEVIRTDSLLSAVKLTSILNGGSATEEEINQLITVV